MKWIVTELFHPDEVSTALIMTEIAEELAKTEEVNIICGPAGYEKTYRPQEKMLNQRIKIHRVNILSLNKNKLASRIFRLLVLSIKMTYQVISKVRKNDEILLVTNPAFLILTLSVVKRFKEFRLVILIHDIFPENLIPGKMINTNSWKYKLLKRIYDSAYRKADQLIVLGNDMEQFMEDKLKGRTPKMRVITNWSDEDIYPIEQFNTSEYIGMDVKNRVVLGFAGNIGRLQGLPEFLEAFQAAANNNIILVITGDGAFKTEVQKIVENQKMPNVVFLGSKPRHEQNKFLNACDIGLISLKPGMKGLGVPSKTYNIMAAGKAILYFGDKHSEVDTYITHYHCGWSFSLDEMPALITFLKNLSPVKKEEIAEAAANSRAVALDKFSKTKVLAQFNTILN